MVVERCCLFELPHHLIQHHLVLDRRFILINELFYLIDWHMQHFLQIVGKELFFAVAL